MDDKIRVFCGNSNPALAVNICEKLGVHLGQAKVKTFSDGEIRVEIGENVRGRDVYIVQSTCSPTNNNLMELLIMMDALKRASAARITTVIPYYGYARQDRKVAPRSPITSKLVADLLTTAGADRVVTVDLHAGQIQGFFNVPVDELNALYAMSNYFRSQRLDDNSWTVVATDVGGEKRARDLAVKLGLPLAIIDKRRQGNTETAEAMHVIGEVSGRNCIILDDEISTGGTIVAAVGALRQYGAREVIISAYHPILAGAAVDRLRMLDVREIVVTDSVPIPEQKRLDNMEIISIAPLFADAIGRIHSGQSVGALFQ